MPLYFYYRFCFRGQSVGGVTRYSYELSRRREAGIAPEETARELGLKPKTVRSAYGRLKRQCVQVGDSYANFVRDSAGYGLCQWTFWSRKAALLEYAQVCKRSIGDLEMQLDFLVRELMVSYPAVLAVLKKTGSVQEASDTVLLQFERPAAMNTEATKAKRAQFGQVYYDKFAKGDAMGFSNSPLAAVTNISPNRKPNRNHVIDTITIHCYVG